MNPIHHHCGPFNTMKGASGPVDNICRDHDMEYEKIGPKAYLMFNKADEKFVKRMSKQKGWLPKVYAGVFKLKKHVTPHLADPVEPHTPVKRKQEDVPLSPPPTNKKPHYDLSQVPNVDSANNAGESDMASSSKRRKPGGSGPRKKRKGSKKPRKARGKRTTVRKRTARRKRSGKSSKFMKLFANSKQNGVVNIKGYGPQMFAWMSTSATKGVWDNKALLSPVNGSICGVYSQKFLWDGEMEAVLNLGVTNAGAGKTGVFQNLPQEVIAGGVVIGYSYQRNNDSEVFLIKNYSMEYVFNNASAGPCDIWIFEFVCTRSCNLEVVDQLYQDYIKQQLFNGGSTAPLSAPSQASWLADANAMGLFTKKMRNWKLVKRVHKHMETKDPSMNYTVSGKNIIWDRQAFNNDNDAGTGTNTYHKGISRDMVVVVRGSMATNGTLPNQVCGFTGGVGVSWLCRRTVAGVRANVQAKQAGMQTIRDGTASTLFAADADAGFNVCNPTNALVFQEYADVSQLVGL